MFSVLSHLSTGVLVCSKGLIYLFISECLCMDTSIRDGTTILEIPKYIGILHC